MVDSAWETDWRDKWHGCMQVEGEDKVWRTRLGHWREGTMVRRREPGRPGSLEAERGEQIEGTS